MDLNQSSHNQFILCSSTKVRKIEGGKSRYKFNVHDPNTACENWDSRHKVVIQKRPRSIHVI